MYSNPNLGTLANNGGLTQTVAAQSGSPALGQGGSVTNLAAPINFSATSFTVVRGDTIARTPGQYLIRVDTELMLVTSVSGNLLTVTRGYAGTTAASHNASVPVYLATDQRGYRLSNGTRDIGALQTHATGQTAAFTSWNSNTFAVGTSGSFTVTASGQPTPLLSENAADILPLGVTFNPVTGVLSGTPFAGSGGNYTLHFMAHNGVAGDASQTFTLSVNEAPSITSADSASVNGGSPLNFAVTTRGFPNPTVSLAPGDTLPPGVTFNPTTKTLSGTPVPGSGGAYTLHFTATNGIGSPATQTFTTTYTAPSLQT